MRNYFFILLLVCGCASTKYDLATKTDFAKMNVDLSSSDSKVKLNGFSYCTDDSNSLSIYGPLGINLIKIVSKHDSLTIVDIQNKRKYLAKIYNVSGSIYNIFHGKFSDKEKHILCSLCSLFVKDLSCFNSETLTTLFDYKISVRNQMRIINVRFYSNGELYTAKIKLINTKIEQSSYFSLAKYVNFETIYLKIQ